MEPVACRVLVVDDDAALLELMCAYLSRLGCSVDTCLRAEDAWLLLESSPSAYSVALVDMNMPGTRGDELARRILGSHRAIRVVMVSGYPPEWNGARGLDTEQVRFLRKPFNPQELADAVGCPPVAR